MVDIKKLANKLSEVSAQNKELYGFSFEVNPIPGDVEVLQIIVDDREEIPIFISVSDMQIICIAYLFNKTEVKSDKVAEMNNEMLSVNITIPLSSFALFGDRYVLYGALSVNSDLSDIVYEIETLSINSIEAIDVMKEYLK